MYYSPSRRIIFVIDTSSYAGNFERQLTAFCTGQYGDCEVGRDEAEKFEFLFPKQHAGFHKVVEQVPDGHGCSRPTSIYATPGMWNDGLGNEYPDAEWGQPHTVEKYRKAVVQHRATHMDPKTAMPGRHPAYYSVAIFFREPPTEEQKAFMMKRAREYSAESQEFKITGFRIVEERIQVTTLWSSEPAS